MAAYSPFDQELTALRADDLAALREAAEGWYIEYKREVPNASSIAKSVSAFANTYGGWLFYGIEEKSKVEAVAGAFPGVARADVDASLPGGGKNALLCAIGRRINSEARGSVPRRNRTIFRVP